MPTMTHEDQMLTPTEAARLMGIEPQTLAAWRCLGRYNLPFLKVGKSIRYRRGDVEAWLSGRSATSTAQLAGC